MNTQGIRGGSDAWSQFVKLAQEARARNSAAPAAVQKSGLQSLLNVAALRRQVSTARIDNGASVSSTTPATGTPEKNAKILGGLFDAYA